MNRPAATAGWLVLLALAVMAGCGFSPAPPAAFALTRAWDPLLESRPGARSEVQAVLEELFGTPDRPHLAVLPEWAERGFDPNRPWVAEGYGGSGELPRELWRSIRDGNRARFADELEAIEAGELEDVGPWPLSPDLTEAWEGLLREGAQAQRARALLVDHYPSLRDAGRLYTKLCLTCHGSEGGGDGPGARFLSPLPRDFREGVFKFSSQVGRARPTRADLVRVIESGIQHTAMPSYAHLSPAERNGLADYVRFLAVRGESELWWLDDVSPDDDSVDATDAQDAFLGVFESWWRSEADEVPMPDGPPAVTAAVLAEGRRLYHDPSRGNCASCHGEEGWGPEHAPRAVDGSEFRDAWGEPIEARDLREGPFRYGDTPEEVYRRLFTGIHGTPMPAVGDVLGADGLPVVSSEGLWALTAYVLALRTGDAP